MNDTIMSEIMGQLAGDEFKHWASHIAAREHIRLERLDNNKQFAEMRTLLEADDDRAAFLWKKLKTLINHFYVFDPTFNFYGGSKAKRPESGAGCHMLAANMFRSDLPLRCGGTLRCGRA